MSDLIALGFGWHELEENFRWTKDKFNIYVLDRDIDSLFITVKCNKVHENYALFATVNDWVFAGKIDLTDGFNMIKIPLNNHTEVKFKCDSFIPTDLDSSNDCRTLGVQVYKITIKCGNTTRDLNIKDIRLKSDIDSEINYNLGESTGFVTLKSGWHELEENKQRWTNGNGEIRINTNRFKKLKLRLFSKTAQFIKILINDTEELSEKLFAGHSDVHININDVNKINIISDPFCPKELDSTSKDYRKLGVMLTNIFVDGDIDFKEIPIKNTFFEHDIPQIMSFIKKYKFKNNHIKTIGGFGDIIVNNLPSHGDGKLNMNDQLVFFSHRSGWSYVIDSLLSCHNENGIKFEGFLEKPFIWNRLGLINEGKLPFQTPWIGVLHNPWDFPTDGNEHTTSETLVKSKLFQDSLKTCKGLYVLSRDLMHHLKKEVNVPVNFFYHPTEFIDNNFDWNKFKNNNNKKILEVGSWLRRYNSIFFLKSNKKIWSKVKIIPALLNVEKMLAKIKFERERLNLIVSEEMESEVRQISPLPDDEYDEFLSQNVVFCDLYASSANNAIIECIARTTPILINKLPAIVEYLGEDYPFYFDSLEEASDKINDMDLIYKTHQYLLESPIRNCLKKDFFLKEFENSKIYKNI